MNNHETTTIVLEGQSVEVDIRIAGLIKAINKGLGIKTYESCENYGDYLRQIELDHVFESRRDYAYVEFFALGDAHMFLEAILSNTGVTSPIYHKVAHEGTPDAYELKWRASTGQPWVWFPSSDIEELEKVLSA